MIESPQGVATSEELAKANEAARNNLSILEAETARLERLISTQKRELIGQENAKTYLEEQHSGLSAKFDALKKAYDEVHNNTVALRKEQEETSTKLARHTAELTGRETALKMREDNTNERALAIDKKERQLARDIEQFSLMQEEYLLLVDNAKEALNKLL